MKTHRLLVFATAALLGGTCAAADAASCSGADYEPSRYQVYIDPPTGYAFIKTPCGWHFVREIESAKVAEAISISGSKPPTVADTPNYVATLGKPDCSEHQGEIR
jgi:hypothetical protein